MWTEQDDEEIEYGKWYAFDAKINLAEQDKIHLFSELAPIWPRWTEGVPKKLRSFATSPSFYLGKVYHRDRPYWSTLRFKWNGPFFLSLLTDWAWPLPSAHQDHWSGVYRISAQDAVIDRCCGRDPTGTLYIGRAGDGGKRESILRTRIKSIIRKDHHATNNWSFNTVLQQQFPWDSLAVEWAYTGTRLNYKGDEISEAIMAESWLLRCYNDSFGELPPWNQKG